MTVWVHGDPCSSVRQRGQLSTAASKQCWQELPQALLLFEAALLNSHHGSP